MTSMNRRQAMGLVAAGAAASTLGGCAAMDVGSQAYAKHGNGHFYDGEGSFDAETAKAV